MKVKLIKVEPASDNLDAISGTVDLVVGRVPLTAVVNAGHLESLMSEKPLTPAIFDAVYDVESNILNVICGKVELFKAFENGEYFKCYNEDDDNFVGRKPFIKNLLVVDPAATAEKGV